jgi:ABC-type dipeptide/oligopeptide/nickel transport system permease subunit
MTAPPLRAAQPGFITAPGRGLSLAILTLFVLLATAPGVIVRADPLEQDIPNRLQMPSRSHLFGTDELGRDLFSRIVHGARISLGTALIAVLLSLAAGVPLGLASGYLGGAFDEVISRGTDVILALPAILVAMTIIAITGRNPLMVAVVIGIVYTPALIRITRAVALKIRNLPYVAAVRTAGASGAYIMFRTILPNSVNEIFVQTLLIGSHAIVIEASLSFLGLGLAPPAPSWGAMLQIGRTYLHAMPWYGIFPGLCIVALVLSLQLLAGDARRRV